MKRINNPNVSISYSELPCGKIEDRDGIWWYKNPTNGKISRLYTRICKICGKVDKGVVKRNKDTLCKSCSMLNKNVGDELGNRFDKLTVVAKAGIKNSNSYYWLECDCGRQCIKRGIGHLRSRSPQQCYLCTANSRANNFKRLTTEIVCEKMMREGYILTSEFINSRTYFTWTCPNGHTGKAVWSNWLGGKRCVRCNRVSAWEEIIAEYLDNRNIEYTREYTNTNCRNIRPLRFDFRINVDGGSVLVEYQGKHHYEGREGIKFGLEYIQNNDRIKKKYCKKNNIPFLEIPYFIENKLKILDKFLSINGVL
jgi:hypothetical protein